MIKTIVVALDGSPLAEEILPYAEELAGKLGIELRLLQASLGLQEAMTGSHVALDIAKAAVEEDRARATTYLEGVARRLRSKGLHVSVQVVEGPPGAVILQHTDAESLICLTTHGRSGVQRTLLGSVADQVVRGSHHPVVVLRPDGSLHS